jgi:glucosinolate gamma-glutamyl hydrolase
MGVAMVTLNEYGREFFSEAAAAGSLKLQQHHRREVAIPPEGFRQLAEGNQCLVNHAGTILTFQGHPEKDAETARLRMHDSLRWFGFDALDEKAWAGLQEMIEMEHDGALVWRRIFQWVGESIDTIAPQLDGDGPECEVYFS